MARKRLLKNLLDLATGTFVSRILGFLRELVTAAFYGTGKSMDLFVIAFSIPAFFRRFLGEDVVERAFMPPFKKLLSRKKQHHAWELLSSCLNLMTVVLIALMTMCYFVAPLIVKAIAPGIEQTYMGQAVRLTYWILPFMVIIGLAAFVGGILNFFEMNRIYALAPAMLSIGVIIGVYGFQSLLGIYALAAGFLLGGLFELLIQIPFLWTAKIRNTQAHYSFSVNVRDSEFRKVGRESAFILLKALFDKSVEIIGRMLASFLAAGSIASLWFSQRLFQLPVAIFGLAISRSLIPYLTEKYALDEDDDFIDGIQTGIRMNYMLIVPAMTIMIVLARPIISLVYQRGSFDNHSTDLTAVAFLYYSLGLLGLSLNAFFSRIFSIFQKNKLPLYISIVTSVLNIALNFLLVKTPLLHAGIALASSVAFSVNSIALFYFLNRELQGRLSWVSVSKEFLLAVCAGIVAGLTTGFVLYSGLSNFISKTVSIHVASVGITLVVGSLLILSIFTAFIFIIGPRSLRQQLHRFLRFLR